MISVHRMPKQLPRIMLAMVALGRAEEGDLDDGGSGEEVGMRERIVVEERAFDIDYEAMTLGNDVADAIDGESTSAFHVFASGCESS